MSKIFEKLLCKQVTVFADQNLKFLSSIFDHVEKRFEQKDKFNFKIYDVTTWSTISYITHIAQYLKK